MAPTTPRPVITVDVWKKPWEQEKPLHNRWHPEIPHVAHVVEGEVFRVEAVDWSGGAIKDNNSADDLKFCDATGHYLSGPIRIIDISGAPARPGDLLSVEILDLGPLPGNEWGFTGTMDRENGGGFLTDHFPYATKAIWYFEGIFAYSPHIPGVRFPGLIHPGLIGTAPSKELLDIWNAREASLVNVTVQPPTLCDILHQRPLANLPTPKGSLLGLSYLLLSSCPCEARLSSIVDPPNAVVTFAIPTAIFDQDIRPHKDGPSAGPHVIRKPDVLKCSYDGSLPVTKNLAPV